MDVIFCVVLGFVSYVLLFLFQERNTALSINISFICSLFALSSVVVYGFSLYEQTRDIPVANSFSLLIGPLLLLLMAEKRKYTTYYIFFSLCWGALLVMSVFIFYFFPAYVQQGSEIVLKISTLSCVGFGSYGYLNYVNKKREIKYQAIAILGYVILLFKASFFFSTVLFQDLIYFKEANSLYFLFSLSALLLACVYEGVLLFVLDKQKLTFTTTDLKGLYFQETNAVLENSKALSNDRIAKKELDKKILFTTERLNPTTVKQLLYINIIDTEVFLDNNLTLTKVAELTQIEKSKLNEYFRGSESMSFKQYINRLKVEYAINVIREREKNITVEELTFICGFNTRLSFYRAFVFFYGFPPSELLND